MRTATGPTVHAVRRLPRDRWPEWDAFVARWGSVEQTTWWHGPSEQAPGTVDVLAWYRDGDLAGGLLVLSTPLPLVRASIGAAQRGPVLSTAEVPGPVVRAVTDELLAVAHERGWIDLRLTVGRSESFARALTTELRNRVERAYTIPGPVDAVVPLAGRTFDEVVAGLHRSTRRDLRAGGRRGGAIRALTSAADLRQAHDALSASARRQGFGGVRAWTSAGPLLQERVSTGDIIVLGLCEDHEVVASTVVALVGPEGYNVYSGFKDHAARLHPGHRLQTAAMAVCQAVAFAPTTSAC